VRRGRPTRLRDRSAAWRAFRARRLPRRRRG
jgi:hypothetical protein